MCFCAKTVYYTVDALTMTPGHRHCNSCLDEAHLTHEAQPCVRAPGLGSASTMAGAALHAEITGARHRTAGRTALSMRRRRQSVALLPPPPGPCTRGDGHLRHSAINQEESAVSTASGVTNKCQQVGELAKMEPTDEDGLGHRTGLCLPRRRRGDPAAGPASGE